MTRRYTRMHTSWWGWWRNLWQGPRQVARRGGSRERGYVVGAEGGSWLWPSSRKSNTRRTKRRGKRVYRVRRR